MQILTQWVNLNNFNLRKNSVKDILLWTVTILDAKVNKSRYIITRREDGLKVVGQVERAGYE